jgi:hypothetical protein
MHARFARMYDARLGARQVEYSAGQVSPTALVAALGRAGVEADTLNSVAGKLLATPYLRSGVSLDALSSSSLLRDRDMHGGAVKAAAILAVRRALAVSLPRHGILSGAVAACGHRGAPYVGHVPHPSQPVPHPSPHQLTWSLFLR